MKLLRFALSLILPAALFGLPFSVISAGDPVLEDLRYVVRESGKSFLSLSPPLSRDEVLLILDGVDAGELSFQAREAYGRVLDRINPPLRYSEGFFGLGAHAVASLEGRFRTNPSIPWTLKDSESPPLISFPVDLFFGGFLQLHIEPFLARDPFYYDEAGLHWGTNVPLQTEQFDMNFPLRAFAAAGGPWWNFELGRDKVSFGSGVTGNLAVSNAADYFDFARISFFSSNVKYSVFVSQLPMDPLGLLTEEQKNDLGTENLKTVTHRYTYIHRLDVRLFRVLSLSLTEGTLVGDSALELRYLNPFIIFHSMFPWLDYGVWGPNEGSMVGSMFAVDVEWAILPSLAVYGQFVMNEFSTSYELRRWPDTQAPNALGYLAGIQKTFNIDPWGLSVYGEFVYTDPFLYVLSSPYCSYIWMRRLSDISSKPHRYAWIGYPEGRDRIVGAAGAVFFTRELSFSLDVSWISRGVRSLNWDWSKGLGYNDQRTPSGSPEYQLEAIIGAGWKPIQGLTLSGHLAGTALFEAGHIRGEREQGLEIMFRVVYTY